MKKKFLLGFGLLAMVLPWTVWAEEDDNLLHDLKVTLSDEYKEGKVYNAENFYEQVKSAVTVIYDGDLEVNPSDYEVTFKKGDAPATTLQDVGTYTVIVTPNSNSAYRKQSPVQTTFTITQRKVTGKFTLIDKITKTYGKDDQSILEELITDFTPTEAEGFDGLATDDDYTALFPSLKVGRYQAENGEDAGTYKVIVEGNESTETNYAFTLASGGGNYAEMTIEPLQLTVTVDEQGYKGSAYTASALNYTIKAGETVINDENPLPFGDELAVNLTAGEGVTLKDVAKDGYTLNVELVAADDNDQKEENKKHYTNVDNYTLVAGQSVTTTTAGFTITPATLDITAKTASTDVIWEQAFGSVTVDADLTKNFTITGWQGDDDKADAEDTPEKKLTLKWYDDTQKDAEKPTAANVYPIKAYYDGEEVGDDNSIGNYTLNYKYPQGETAWNFTITGKGINNFEVTPINDNVIYQGQDYDLALVKDKDGKTNVVAVKDGGTTLVEGTDYEVARTAKATDEDYQAAINASATFEVTISGKGNYSGSKTATLTIQKAPLTIALTEGVTSLGKTYGDATESDNLYGQYLDITGWKLEEKTTVGGNLKMVRHGHGDDTKDNECAGSYSIYLYNGDISNDTYLGQLGGTLNELENYYFEAYEGGIQFVISPKPITYWIASAEKKYDATANLANVKITYATEGEDGETGLIEGDTFENIFGVFTNDLFTTEAGVAPTVALAEGENNEGVNVGDYKLTVANSENVKANNYILTYSSKEEGSNYKITKRTLTITAADQTIDFGTTEEDIEAKLKEWFGNYRTNFVDNEQNADDVTDANRQLLVNDRMAVGKMYTFELSDEAKTGASGTYDNSIVITWNEELTDEQQAILANYGGKDAVVLEHGTLTIGNYTEELVLDGAEDADVLLAENPDAEILPAKLARLNGAKVEKIVIKNLYDNITYNDNTLYPGIWYSLVLPFDVTVREVSNAFGYAIVNVPEYTKGTAQGVYFHLEMGKVPANTLMLFKVDETQTWDDQEENHQWVIEATGDKAKTIVAPGEWKSDAAGNQFIGVYRKTEINQANQMYLAWTGAFYDAATSPKTLYPLNGYVETAVAGARIFVEEADGTITAINAVTGEAIHNKAEGWYTIGGVKLNGEPTEKGVYINNGVKVVIK